MPDLSVIDHLRALCRVERWLLVSVAIGQHATSVLLGLELQRSLGAVDQLSMMLEDAVDQRLIPTNPVRHHKRRRRRHDHAPTNPERVWAMPDHVIRIAEQATMRGGPSAGLIIISAAWTGCRWGELAGLQRDHLDLKRGTLTIDPEIGALHESASNIWLGPPKTPASARTITLPPFLIALLRKHLDATLAPSCSPADAAATYVAARSTAESSAPPSTATPDTASTPSGPA